MRSMQIAGDPWADDRRLETVLEGARQRRPARTQHPTYLQRMADVMRLFSEAEHGDRTARYYLQEALTTSDFPQLFGDVLDRQMLARYQEWPATWPAIAERRVVNDFRDVKLFPPVYGAESRLDSVAEFAEYPHATLTEQAPLTLHVGKYGRKLKFSWEAMINDDLRQLMDIPRRFALAARRTEERLIADLFVGTSGPNTSLYTVGNANIINTTNGSTSGDNPPLSIAALQDAWRVLHRQTDESGEPMYFEFATLVVPPALEVTARNILNATTVELTRNGGNADVHRTDSSPSATGEARLVTQNWMRDRVQLVVNPYIPVVASVANGHTSWFLFGNPNLGRPALTIAFLRGHEQPEIWLKEPNARRVGGGAVDPMDGDFDEDGVHYRVRHVAGAVQVSGKVTAMSNGSGS